MDTSNTRTPKGDPPTNICTESTARGVQSHLSTMNSQQRLRPTATYLPPTGRLNLVFANQPAQHEVRPSFINFLKKVLFPAANFPHFTSDRLPQARPWSIVCLRWAVLVYSFLSVVFFSVKIYNLVHRSRIVNLNAPKEDIKSDMMIQRLNISLFDGLSMRQRLSRISSQWPPPTAFDAFVIRGDVQSEIAVVTACIWMSERDELGLLLSWAASWRGPISLLMTTTVVYGSPAHNALLRRLRGQKEHLLLSGISIHLLHIENDNGSPNSYLNIARLFAPTPLVMLVPANLSNLPLISCDDIKFRERSLNPFIVSVIDRVWSSYSDLPPLSPLIIQRNHPVWCTDRFFIHNTRIADWRECLWQFWIASFGGFGNLEATGQLDTSSLTPDIMNPIRNRFSVRFRAEICNLTARTMATIGVKNYKDGKKKLAWLKQTCGQHVVERMFKIA